MRLRNIPGADEYLSRSPYVVQEPENLKGKWREKFGNSDAPVELEIGCGKGRFFGNVATLGPAVQTVLVTVNRKLEK